MSPPPEAEGAPATKAVTKCAQRKTETAAQVLLEDRTVS